VSGAAVFTKSVSGTNPQSEPVSLDASTTLGALVQVRYTKSPLLGAEFNYSYARFTENFSGSPFGNGPAHRRPFGVQTNASEYTVGYVAHLPSLLGFQPFAAAGAGATAFKPTPLGGQGLPERARATYYYDIGIDDQFTRFFGVRAQFRQALLQSTGLRPELPDHQSADDNKRAEPWSLHQVLNSRLRLCHLFHFRRKTPPRLSPGSGSFRVLRYDSFCLASGPYRGA
jgi:hypothetical protein